jgi:hypothetical protein
VQAELERDGFKLAEEKWRVVRRGRGLSVTGLSLEDGVQPRVPKAMKRRIRQELHYAEKFGCSSHVARRGYGSSESGLNRIEGTIRYIRGIERDRGQRFQKKWTELLVAQGLQPDLVATGELKVRDALFLVDESVVDGPAGKVMLVALIIVEDVDLIRQLFERRLSKRVRAEGPQRKASPGPTGRTPLPEDRRTYPSGLRPRRSTSVLTKEPAQAVETMTIASGRILDSSVQRKASGW